jgi:hypothetical protein
MMLTEGLKQERLTLLVYELLLTNVSWSRCGTRSVGGTRQWKRQLDCCPTSRLVYAALSY